MIRPPTCPGNRNRYNVRTQCGITLRPGGYLAMVLGEPVAKAFDSLKIVERVDALFGAAGFDLIWKCWRPIHWHRNQGYQRLRKERIAVYEFD